MSFFAISQPLAAVAFGWFLTEAPILPPKPREVVYVKKTIVVRKTFDMQGKLYAWKGAKPKGQKEGQPAMFRIVGANAGLRNGQIRDAPDGVHLLAEGAFIDEVVFRTIVEDAVTIRAKNCKVRNSWFHHAEDKAIQHNAGSNVVVEGNVFVDCAKAYRLPDEQKKEIKATFRDNWIYRRGSVHTETPKVTISLLHNRWIGVRHPLHTGESHVVQRGNSFEGPFAGMLIPPAVGAHRVGLQPVASPKASSSPFSR